MTFYTGDVEEAGTDSQVFIKVFGVKGSSSDVFVDKMSERFERGMVDLIKVGRFFHSSSVRFAKLTRNARQSLACSMLGIAVLPPSEQ